MRAHKLATELIMPLLKKEVDNILCMIKQGFDLHIYTDFNDIQDSLFSLLNREVENNPNAFYLARTLDEVSYYSKSGLDQSFAPIILLGNQILPMGHGFARYNIKSPDKIIDKPASAISKILKNFGLETYIECFDSEIFSKLKEICKIYGVHALIDAVVQTAFIAGLNGEQSEALHYLSHFHTLHNDSNVNSHTTLSTSAKKFLSYCVSHGDDSMDFIKSCLCFYVVDNQNRSMTQASQILNISRTTLSEYMKTADRLHVSYLFH